MGKEIAKTTDEHSSPFERIKRVNETGNEYWSSREFAGVLEYTQYRNFEGVIEKAKLSCFNSGRRIEDHFADVSKMIEIGKGGRRKIKVTLFSRYACYLIIQNADPRKEIVAHSVFRSPSESFGVFASRRLAALECESSLSLCLRGGLPPQSGNVGETANKKAGASSSKGKAAASRRTPKRLGAAKAKRLRRESNCHTHTLIG